MADSDPQEHQLRQRFISQLLEAPWTQILVTLVVVLAMVFIAKVLLQDQARMDVSETKYARGFITVLFGVGTIGIAVIVTLSGVFLTGDGAKDRFDRGKEVLSLILGIFGTIVGFYYGTSVSSEKAAPNEVPSLSRQNESNADPKAMKPSGKIEPPAEAKKAPNVNGDGTGASQAQTKPST